MPRKPVAGAEKVGKVLFPDHSNMVHFLLLLAHSSTLRLHFTVFVVDSTMHTDNVLPF